MVRAEDFINMKIELIPVIEITNYDQDVPKFWGGSFAPAPKLFINNHSEQNNKLCNETF